MKIDSNILSLTLLIAVLCVSPAWSQSDPFEGLPPDPNEQQEQLFDQFSTKMSGSTLVGNFTIDGQAGEPKEERYELKGVTKLPVGDYWMFNARIRYGDHDVTVPLSLQVKWAATTPVITLDNVTVPGLGTFNARVLIDGQHYAGTWQHGEVGGLLYGKIESKKPPQDESGEKPAAVKRAAGESPEKQDAE